MNLTENKMVIGGLSINYVEGGSGAPMIFMHNGGGFWQSWKKQLDHFSKQYKVYGIDWPGFGESDSPDGLISLQLLADTLKGFVEQKNLKDVILVGNCIGGSAALHYANHFPKEVKKLIIFNVCPGDLIFPFAPLRPLIRSLNKTKRIKKGAGAFLKFVFTKTPVRRRFPPILFAKKHNREDEIFQKYIDKNGTVKQNASRTNLVFSVHTFRLDRFAIQQKNFPHVLVWGEENSVVTLKRHGHFTNGILKPEKFITIPGAGHLCMYEKEELINEIITNHIQSK